QAPETSARAALPTMEKRACSRELHADLVHIAPAPALARLERGDDRMLRRVEMLRGVLVLRVVAAADVAAGAAKAQVQPAIAGPETLLAALGAGAVGLHRPEMAAAHPRYF